MLKPDGHVGDVGHASLHQEDGLDTDGDQNPEEHSAGAALVGDRRSFEQVFSKDESIWVRRALSIPGDQVWDGGLRSDAGGGEEGRSANECSSFMGGGSTTEKERVATKILV